MRGLADLTRMLYSLFVLHGAMGVILLSEAYIIKWGIVNINVVARIVKGIIIVVILIIIESVVVSIVIVSVLMHRVIGSIDIVINHGNLGQGKIIGQ